jgi:hypothetical protein
MIMYDLCERCYNEIAWDPDFADYVSGRIVTMSLVEQNGVFIESEHRFEAWCDDCRKKHAKYNKKTHSYSAA